MNDVATLTRNWVHSMTFFEVNNFCLWTVALAGSRLYSVGEERQSWKNQTVEVHSLIGKLQEWSCPRVELGFCFCSREKFWYFPYSRTRFRCTYTEVCATSINYTKRFNWFLFWNFFEFFFKIFSTFFLNFCEILWNFFQIFWIFFKFFQIFEIFFQIFFRIFLKFFLKFF